MPKKTTLKKKIQAIKGSSRDFSYPPFLKKVMEEHVSKVIEEKYKYILEANVKGVIVEFQNLLGIKVSHFDEEMSNRLEDISAEVDKKISEESTTSKQALTEMKKEISSLLGDINDFSEVIRNFSLRDERSFKLLNDSLSQRIEMILSRTDDLSRKNTDIENRILKTSYASKEELLTLEVYEKDLGKKVSELDAWVKKASKDIYEFGASLQVSANNIFKGQALAINFKNGTNTTVTVAVNSQTGALDVSVNAAITGANSATESLTPTVSGNNITLDLTGLSHTFVGILFVTRQGQILNSSASDGWSRVGNIITITNASILDSYQIGYTY